MNTENKNASKNKGGEVFGKLLNYIKPMWGILLAVVILSFLGSMCNVIIPTFTKNIVNETQVGITEGFNLEAILKNIFFTLVTLGAAFLCNMVQAFISPLLAQKTAYRLREDTNAKVNRIPLNYFDTTAEGDTLSTMTNDIDTVSTSFSSTLPTMITAVATLIGCIVLMFVTSPVLAVTTIVASFLGLMISSRVLSGGSKYFKDNQNLLGRLNGIINEDIKGHLIIKSFNAETDVLDEFKETNKALFESTRKTQLVTFLMVPLSAFSSNLSYILVCIVGAILVFGGKTQIGTIIAFIQYAQIFATPVSTITQSAGTIQPALAAGERIFTLLEKEEMSDSGREVVERKNVKGHVEFSHVKFGYNPENIILHDFSYEVLPGQKIAIVGPTGSGKSTLINLLTRFYEVNGGDIRIDGKSIYDMPRESLHSIISMVLQETWTFKGSIRDNILYSNAEVSDERLHAIIRDCGLEDFVEKSADKLDTVISEDADVSGGQKQLITIARAMVDDAPILVLDEATSSVDTRTEKLISEALDKLTKNRTSFVIAHRLSTIKNADAILVLKDGDIIEIGTHDELMAQKGFYKELYMSQFSNKQI